MGAVKEGLHSGAYHSRVITVKRDGVFFEIPWRGDMKIEPSMIDAMLNDMGVGEDATEEPPEVRAATKEYCIKQIEEIDTYSVPGTDFITWSDMEERAWAFVSGYESCILHLGKLLTK